MGDLVGCAFAYRLGEFPDLFAEPGNRWGDPAVAVSVTVGVVDHLLEFAQVHTVTVPGALAVDVTASRQVEIPPHGGGCCA